MKKAFTPTFRISEMNNFQKNLLNSLSWSCTFVVISLISFSSFAQVTGTVFKDFNANGTKEATTTFTEPGIAGVTVKAFNAAGAQVGATATTAANGTYTIAGVSGALRVEFTAFPTGIYEGPKGAASNTSVQFVTAPAANTNLGINCPEDYCQANPKLVTVCYDNGSGVGNTNAVMVGIDYTDTGSAQNEYPTNATADFMGSTWGVAYDKTTKLNYVSAFLKRQAGLGDRGLDGIYVVNYSTATPSLVGGFDLEGVVPSNGGGAISFGSVTRTLIASGNGTGINDLSASRTNASRDADAYAKVGKVGYGDIDIDQDTKTLWAVNLNERSLIAVDISSTLYNTAVPTTVASAKVKRYFINGTTSPFISGLPSCPNGVMRPFGLKIRKDKGYLGVVCDGSSLTTVDMSANQSAYVLSFDLASPTAFTQVASVPLNYNREESWVPFAPAATFDALESDNWQRWHDTYVDPTTFGSAVVSTNVDVKSGINGFLVGAPQPILADIEFLPNDDMVLGFIDRFGHQGGWNNYIPTSSTILRNVVSHGDILLASKSGSGYIFEGPNENDNFTTPPVAANAQAGQELNDGPSGAGEFFYQDYYIGFDATHAETALGGLAVLPGSNEVTAISFDPAAFNSMGVRWLNYNTGAETRNYTIVANTGIANFGKGAALGDVELLCNIAPIEIGNRVWKDTDKDGIQDADEAPLVGVRVVLYNSSNVAVDTTTTDANGNYFFSSTLDPDVKANTSYRVKVVSLGTNASVSGLTLTDITNAPGETAGQNTGQTINNNDAFLSSNIPTILFTTGNWGENNHSLDFGFVSCIKPNLTFTVKPATCTNGKMNNDGLLTVIPVGADKVGISYGGTSYAGPDYANASTDFTLELSNTIIDSTKIWIRVFAGLNNTACRKDTSFTLAPTLCPTPKPCNAAPGEIGGNVFRDYNNTGTKDSLEIGLAGISVKVYDCDGKLLGTTVTDQFGNYSFAGMPSDKVRIEFGALPSPYIETKAGTDNGTKTQFVTAPDCTVDLGVNDPSDYCQENPLLVTTCFVNGDPLLGGTTGPSDYMVAWNYYPAANKGVNNYVADGTIIGTTWGIAYHKTEKQLFTSAFLKRHAGFGVGGPGTIYTVNMKDTSNITTSKFIDLKVDLGIDVGTDPRITSGVPLPANKNEANYDSLAFDLIGKMSLGDIDISEDQRTLWVTNLKDRTLIELPIGNPPVKPTSYKVHNLPNPSCVNGVFRVFATKIYRGDVYVGGVCTAENGGTRADLKAIVYKHNAAGATSSFTEVLSYPLNYPRGYTSYNGTTPPQFVEAEWNPWISKITDIPVANQHAVYNQVMHPQPMLSDIEFDVNGDMIMSFSDRLGHQFGNQNWGTSKADTVIGYEATAAGDILRASWNGSAFTLENNATSGNITTKGANQMVPIGGQGPGGGEYYWQDIYGISPNPNSTGGHQEISNGSLVLLAGTNEIVSTVYDPLTEFRAAGVRYYNNTTGEMSRAYQIFGQDGGTPNQLLETFAKGANLGDIEALCDIEPIEIGNRLWIDKDGDGVQDPCEEPIANVSVSLYDKNGTLIAQTTTDVNGNYYFNETNVVDTLGISKPNFLGPQPLTDYLIVIGKEDGSFDKTTGTLGTTKLSLTDPNSTISNGNDQNDSDATIGGAALPVALQGYPVIAATTPASGSDHSFDAGFVAYGSIGDYVWTDTNNDGQQTSGEAPIAGVKVYLLNASGVKLDSTVTDATGKYLFDSLLTGAYKVQFVAPAGTIAAKQNTGADVTDSDANEAGLSQLINIDTTKLPTDTLRNNPQIDAGFVPVGSLGDYVFNDKDGDGVQDATDTPIAGIKVYLLDATTGAKLDSTVTDALGKYTFDSLLTGDYKVQFVIPAGSEASPKIVGTDTTKDSNINPDGITDTVSINTALPLGDGGRNNPTIDAGIKPAYGSIGDYVWTDQNNNGQQDGTEAPIAGVKVYLLDGTTGAKLDSALTDATGKYLFDSLLTGAYKVQFVAPAGTIAAKQNTGADVTDSDANGAGLSQLINIDTSKLTTDTLRNNPQIDAGFVPVGSIGDYVFEDLDKSNTQTAGDTPLAGVKVYLLDATTGVKLDSTTTDAAGLYLFDSLVAGNYKVQFVAPSGTLLVGKTSGTDVTKDSNPDPTTGITDAVTIDTTQPIGSPARDNRDVDAGIKLIPAYGSIGDYVWSDVNDNGQQDGTEAPIAGVKVYLYDATGTSKLDSALTDASGKYLFDSLLTGAYKVKFVAPAGSFPSNQNTGADVSDSDANDLGWSQVVNIDATKAETDTLRNNPQIDAGFVPFGSIGDYVFNDKDNSNTQTAGDLPVEGVKVYLLDATTGAKLDSTVTNAAGLYKFDSLIAGNYKVQVVPPTGMLVVTKDSGADDTKDSDIDATGTTGTVTVDVTKPVGDPLRDITSVDAGIKGNPQYGSIGDYVWFDVNNDGQQGDPLVEKPIVGVKVYLYDATGTTKLDSTLTDALGKYNFDSLLTGGYKVKFESPAGTFPAKQNTGADISDSDANKLGWSQVVNIDVTKLTTDTLRNNPQIDAGFVPFGSLGDYVFEDKDNSNTQTAGDLPISGVKVYLLDATTGAKLDSTITDGAGKYLFDSLVAGNYKVQFVAPSGSLLVTKTSGTDATKDSNPDPTTGITDAVTIDTTKPIGDPTRDVTTVDAGVKAAPQFGSIGDYVWTDTNNNGQQDATETPIAGVKVYLYDATGTTKLDSTLTDASGKYLFDSLITAGYKVQFVAPAGTIAAKQNTGADVSDSDANKLGWSQVINIDASLADTDTLRNNPQIDAGFVPVGSIGDYVFIDKDNSNTQTAGDLPMEGVKVYLLDATTGAKLDSTLTDASGLYKFDSLIAGNYKVQFVVPTGMTAVNQDSGADDAKDSDIDNTGKTGTVTVDTTKPIGDPLRDITNVDAGLKGVPQYGSLGDYVWFDNNNNGQQDGTESPIQGVKVYLYDAAGTTKLDSALTDATGKYLFDSLLTGAYKVQFVAPTGTLPAKQNTGADVSDSDANATGWSQVVNIDVTKLATDTLRNNPQIDAGFVPFGSIGDFVFQDKDNSNTQTVADTPIPCIVVYLLDATTGAKLDSTMTDISGKYLFDSLLAGNYKVQFVAPIGGTFVTPLSGGDVIKDSNPDATGLTATVTIDPTQPIGSPARDNRDVDAGLKIVGPFGSIGDYVWSDVNNNGQQDGTEAPIAGVKVYLYDGTGTVIMDSTVTDATGKYLFDSLFTADYKVRFVAPAGTIASKQNTGADVTDSDANNAGWSQVISIDVTKLATDTLRNNPQIDAGFVPVGSIGDYVFEDKDNSNTQTAGDAPIQGVKVYLLNATTGAKLDSTITDGAGKYLFDSLIAGNYKVQFIAPSGTDLVTKTSGTDVTKDSNPDPMTGITDAVTIDTTQPIGSPARDNRDVDAGIKASLAYGSLGDYVWMDTDNDGQQDAAEAPIAGVKVYLYDASGTTKLDSTLTDASGKYLFDSLLTGGYKVKFVAPAGTIAAKQNTGADVSDSDANKLGWSQVVNIDVTLAETDTLRNNPKIDAGFIPVGSIGDYVFNDKDNSNTQTTGDLPIEGVKVYLLDATTGAKLDSTVTNSAGLYKFDSLVAGNYKVQVVAPTGMTVVTKDSGTDDTKDSDIDPTGTTGIVNVDTTKPIGDPLRDITNVDAGLKGNPAYGSIGNFVWTDQNNNGQQDGTETPIEGVKVYLYDGTGTVLLDSTLTNAAGNYLFDSLLTGAYKVQFVAPAGTIPAKQNTGADVSDSDANKLGWSQVVNIDVTKASTDTLRNNPQIDAGFVPVGSIGDYVFNDKDDSKTQTAGDLPIGGVKVYLLNATTGAKLDSTITDGAGKYLFDSLVAGNYKVQFVAPVGTNLVTKTSGTDVTKDSNPDPTTGITDAVTIDTTQPIGSPARDNRDVDAGIKGELQYGSLGDYVWMDTDNDGQQDATEAPIAGVKVYLYDAAGLVKIDSALTDATGKYLFDSLLTGGYKVQFVAPVGTIAAKQNTGADVTDSDANKAGWSQVVNIDVTLSSTDTLRNNPQIDAGFVPVGSIGDYVFVDNDNSNTQTVGDTPVAGIKVYLLDAITGAKLDSTVTNINGLYKFDSLLAGNYKVQFVAPTGATLVTKDSGADDTKDSDADSTGTTGIVTVDTTKPVGDIARDITSVDAGLSFKVDLRLTKVAVGDCKRKVGDVVAFKIMVKRQDLIITDVTTTIKDSLSANFEFVSATATEGTYSNTTGIWSGITLAQGDSAVLTVNARIKQGVAGLACNDAWIQTMDKGDFDSIAGNKIESEDDFARACVSVPLPVCTARGEKAELAAPAGYTNYQWFKNGQVITGATSSTYLATTFGEYTVTVNNGSCPSTGCCPIYVEEFCDCPPTICVPFVIQKTKSKK